MDGGSRGLQVVLSRPFLLRCLTDTGLEDDIVEDIADVCEAHELSALSLARQELPLKEASDKLFLTNREVEVLFEVCKDLCGKEGVAISEKGAELPPAGPVKHVAEIARGTPVAPSPTRSCGAFSVGRLSVDGVDAYSVGKLSTEDVDDAALTVDTDSCDSCGEEEVEAVPLGSADVAEEVWAASAEPFPPPKMSQVKEAPKESPYKDDGNRSPFKSAGGRCPFPLEDEEPSEPAVVEEEPADDAEGSYVGEVEEYRPLSLNPADLAEEEFLPTGSTDSCIISELEAAAAAPQEELPAGDPSTPCSIGHLLAVQSGQAKESTSSQPLDGLVEPHTEGLPPLCPGHIPATPFDAAAVGDLASEWADEVPPSLSEFGEDFLRTGGTERGASELSTSEIDLVDIRKENKSRRVLENAEALQLDLSDVVVKEPPPAPPEPEQQQQPEDDQPAVPCNRAPTPFPAESARTKKRRDALALGHVLLRAQGAGLDLDLQDDINTAPGVEGRMPRQDAAPDEATKRDCGGDVCSSTHQSDSKAIVAVKAPRRAGGLPRCAPVPRKVGEGLMVRTGACSTKREDASSPQSEGPPSAAQVVVNSRTPQRALAAAVPVVEQRSFEEQACAHKAAFDGGSRTDDGPRISGQLDPVAAGDGKGRGPRTTSAIATSEGAEVVASVAIEEKDDLLQWFEDPPVARPVAPKPMSIRRSRRSVQEPRPVVHSAPVDLEDSVLSPGAPREDIVGPVHVAGAQRSSLHQRIDDCGPMNARGCVEEDKMIAWEGVLAQEEKHNAPAEACVEEAKKVEAGKERVDGRGASMRVPIASSASGWQPPVPQRVKPSQVRPQQPEKPAPKGLSASPEEIYYRQVKEAEAAKKRQSQAKTKTMAPRAHSGLTATKSAGRKMERHVSVERHERSNVQVTQTVVKTVERKQGSKVIREREEKITRVSTPARVSQFMKSTVAHSPKLASAARAHHWKKVIDPKKQEKMEDLQKKQEEKRAKELEARDRVVRWTRESIVFKEGELPDFGECLEGDMQAAAFDAIDHDDMDGDGMGQNGMNHGDMGQDVLMEYSEPGRGAIESPDVF